MLDVCHRQSIASVPARDSNYLCNARSHFLLTVFSKIRSWRISHCNNNNINLIFDDFNNNIKTISTIINCYINNDLISSCKCINNNLNNNYIFIGLHYNNIRNNYTNHNDNNSVNHNNNYNFFKCPV